MKKRKGALLAALALTACTKHVEFDSIPRGAHVWVNGQDLGVTPTRGDFSYTAFSNFEVILAKDGYEQYRGHLAEDVEVGKLIIGIVCCWPALLWVQGPIDHQMFSLIPLGGAWQAPPTGPAPQNAPQTAPTWQPGPDATPAPTAVWHPQPDGAATSRPAQQTPTPPPAPAKATPTPADPWDFGDPK